MHIRHLVQSSRKPCAFTQASKWARIASRRPFKLSWILHDSRPVFSPNFVRLICRIILIFLGECLLNTGLNESHSFWE
jgi:hypothetical protein